MQNPEDFKVYRCPEGQPESQPRWYRLRKGVADLHRRAEICQQANERYLNALAVVDSSTTLEELMADIQRPVIRDHKRSRALNPFSEPDVNLLEVISRGEFLLNGLRNRDLQALLYSGKPASAVETRRRSAAVSRKLRLLRAHRLIRKVPRTHRYHITDLGRKILPAILAARKATLNQMNAKAA
jgi:hypothetical protein